MISSIRVFRAHGMMPRPWCSGASQPIRRILCQYCPRYSDDPGQSGGSLHPISHEILGSPGSRLSFSLFNLCLSPSSRICRKPSLAQRISPRNDPLGESPSTGSTNRIVKLMVLSSHCPCDQSLGTPRGSRESWMSRSFARFSFVSALIRRYN